MKQIILFFAFFTLIAAAPQDTLEAVLTKNFLKKILANEDALEYLEDAAENYQIDVSRLRSFRRVDISKRSTCELCDVGLNAAILALKNGIPEFIVKGFVLELCNKFQIEDERVCNGLLGPQMDVMFYIIKNKDNVKAEEFCSLLLPPTCHNQFDYYDWTIDLPPRPLRIPEKIISESSKNIRILQVTDIHYDPRYTPGTKAICGEIICCQDDQGTPDDSDEACGYWGDYRAADTSTSTLHEALRHMKTQDIDYVYFTGDIISHRMWDTSVDSNGKEEREVMGLLRNNFDVPVLFVLGNHEPHPVNLYAPSSITKDSLSTNWLFDQLADQLKDVISDDDLKNVESGGFYTILLKSGFRVIVLNNSICFTYNLWLAFDSFDPYGQLQWLVKVLEQAERNGEYVHILHHVPTGEKSCLTVWAREFTRIINRFSDTVKGQFNGHTHLDEFFLYFNETNGNEAIHVAFNGASIATFQDNNPSYKIYDIDAHNYAVVDVEEWTFNLTAANIEPVKSTVDWYKLYSFKDTYGVSSMKAKDLYELSTRMAQDESILQMYAKNMYRMGSGADKQCDDDCYKLVLCRIVTSNIADSEQCEKIKKVYDDNHQA